MTVSTSTKSQINYARLAGLMYLFVIAADLSGMWITSRFNVPGDFAGTAHNIMASELLYRIGLCGVLAGSLGTVLLAMGLYVVVKPINENLALLALLFRLVESTAAVSQSFINFIVLNLYLGPNYTSAFDAKQLQALVGMHSIWASASSIAAIFFGFGSILFFYLFLKSTYIPKALSALGFFASLLVPIVSLGALVSPSHAGILQFGWLPILVAELSVGLWLLIRGIKVETPSL